MDTSKKGSSSKQGRRRAPSELAAIDFSFSGVKIVRFKRAKDGLGVTAVDLLPPVAFGSNGHTPDFEVPRPFITNYAAVAVSGEKSMIRLLSVTGSIENDLEARSHIREHMAVSDDFRLSYLKLPSVDTGKGRAETRMLAVALPDQEAASVLRLLEAGPPAPRALEISGLASLTAFLCGPGGQEGENAVGVIEAGARTTVLALFNKGQLALVRKFEFGAEYLVGKVQQQMGVEYDVAKGIISDGSFDISESAREVMGPFLRQLSISRDFVERKENCRIGRIYLSGGMSQSHHWVEGVQKATGTSVEIWNPFEAVSVAPGAIPDSLQGQEMRFAGAVGAALGVYDDQ